MIGLGDYGGVRLEFLLLLLLLLDPLAVSLPTNTWGGFHAAGRASSIRSGASHLSLSNTQGNRTALSWSSSERRPTHSEPGESSQKSCYQQKRPKESERKATDGASLEGHLSPVSQIAGLKDSHPRHPDPD